MADEKSIYDLVVDELVDRQRMVREELFNRFKKTRPFRTEPPDTDEMILNYKKMTPEAEQEMRLRMGDAAVDNYIVKMKKLMQRRGL